MLSILGGLSAPLSHALLLLPAFSHLLHSLLPLLPSPSAGINVITPLPNSVGPAPPPLVMPPADFPHNLPTQLLTNLQVDYSLDHCEGCLTSTDGSAVIRMDNKADGERGHEGEERWP